MTTGNADLDIIVFTMLEGLFRVAYFGIVLFIFMCLGYWIKVKVTRKIKDKK